MKMNDVIRLEMENQKGNSNEFQDLGSLIETTGMMSSGVLSLQETTQGVSGSCFNLESYASGILTCQDVANQSLGGLASSAGQTVGYTAELNSQAQSLLPLVNKICNGVVLIAKNTGKGDDLFSQLGSLGGLVSGVVGVATFFNAVTNPLTGIALVATALLGVAAFNESRKGEDENEALLGELDRPAIDQGEVNQQSTTAGTSSAAANSTSQVGNLSQTIASGVVTVQEAALQNLSVTAEGLSLMPDVVNLTLDTLNVIVQGASSFVFQQGVNFGLAGLELRYSPVWGAPVAARPGTLPAVRPKTLADECKTFRELDYEAGLAGRTRPQASVENNSSTSNVSHSSSENSVTSEWGAQNYHTFAPVFHMYGLTIKHESDFEEVAAYLAERLHDAMKSQPAGSYTNQSGGSASRDK